MGQKQSGFVAGWGVKPGLAHANQTLPVAGRGRLLEHGLGLGAELQLVRLPALRRQRADQPGGLAADRGLGGRAFVGGEKQVFHAVSGKRLQQGGCLAEPLLLDRLASERELPLHLVRSGRQDSAGGLAIGRLVGNAAGWCSEDHGYQEPPLKHG